MSIKRATLLRPLSVVITVLVSLTVALDLLYLFTPVLIGYQTTSNGIIEYFTNTFDPAFVIKAYLNGSPTNAIISVFVNQPNKVRFFEEYYGETLEIPFSSIAGYVKPWEKYRNVNTSLLVIVTYVNGSNAYSAAEDIEYNPSWVLNNMPIQIVAKINIIPKLIKINTTAIEKYANELNSLRKQLLQHSAFIYPGPGGGSNYAYIVNMSQEAYVEPPTYTQGNILYVPSVNITYFYNFSVPINWITLSNNVSTKDEYSGISLTTKLIGNVCWYAVSNSTNYGGPYIGVSYSADVNWVVSTYYSKSILSNLDDPTVYNYYNATIAVVLYSVKKIVPHEPIVPTIANVTVFQVLWASPNIGGAVETSNGVTCVVYTNSSGTYYYPLSVGNGSVTLFYTFFKKFIGNLRSGEYGYAIWNNGNIVTGSPVEPNSGGPIDYVYFSAGSLDEYVQNDRVAGIAFDAVGLILTTIMPVNALLDAALDVALDAAEYFLLTSSTQVENYFTDTLTQVYINTSGTGQFYVTYLNYSYTLNTPLLGFILNYSSYYKG